MLTFAVADLHGRYDLFLEALEKIEDYADEGTVVFLGDYIDRGPQSAHILKALRGGTDAEDWDWVVLRGNHEEMMYVCIQGIEKLGWWYGNGGIATMESYANLSADPYEDLPWIHDLPLYYEDKHRIFVHAGIDPQVPMDKQKSDNLMWKIYNGNTWVGHEPTGKHVCHGHDQHAKGPLSEVGKWGGRTALDTFAWKTGRLVVAVFDDETPGGPVDYIEIKRDEYDWKKVPYPGTYYEEMDQRWK
jgi:serine/threonine protein phosphatase 1